MTWIHVEITGNDDVVYIGDEALSFVRTNCKSLLHRITGYHVIEVNTGLPTVSTEDRVVRSALFTALKGAAKKLRFLTLNTAPRSCSTCQIRFECRQR